MCLYPDELAHQRDCPLAEYLGAWGGNQSLPPAEEAGPGREGQSDGVPAAVFEVGDLTEKSRSASLAGDVGLFTLRTGNFILVKCRFYFVRYMSNEKLTKVRRKVNHGLMKSKLTSNEIEIELYGVKSRENGG